MVHLKVKKDFKLYNYQLEVFDKTIKALQEEKRALIVMATGTGKTDTSIKILEHFLKKDPKKEVLILCHTVEILDQLSDRLENYWEIKVNRFYGNKLDHNSNFTVASFQSVHSLIKNGNSVNCDYLVVDESHHSGAETYTSVLSNIQSEWRLGLTATPNRLDGKDIREQFGEEVVNLDITTAIQNNYLTPCKIKIMSCDLDEEKLELIRKELRRKNFSLKDLDRLIFIEQKLESEAKTIQEEIGEKQAIIYCSSINHIIQLGKYLPNSKSIHVGKEIKENQKILEDFREGKFQFILSVNKLNEGIDVPSVPYGVFMRSTQSERIVLQQLGRILRKFEGKKEAIILDFVSNLKHLKFLRDLELKFSQANNSENSAGDEDTQFDIVISNQNLVFEWSQEVLNLLDLLDSLGKYETLEEHREAWLKLVIENNFENNQPSYVKNYKLDPKLWCWMTIKNKFGITGWEEFITGNKKVKVKVKKYQSLEEHLEAWLKLVSLRNLKNNQGSYEKNYRLDPKLWSWKAIQNKFGISGWNEFLDQVKYSTLKEHQEAWGKLVSEHNFNNNIPSYFKNYKLDSKLLSWYTVQSKFGITSWEEFISDKKITKVPKYQTLDECREAWKKLCEEHNLDNNQPSYCKNYKLDPKLWSWTAIQNKFGITSWYELLNQ